MEKKKFFCSICDASCGLIAHVKNNKVMRITPDKHHPISKGYCCPKGLSIHHVTNDPDRRLFPMRYDGREWRRLSWKAAMDEISMILTSILEKHGPHAIATHMGTNGGHCFSHSMYWKGFCDALGTRNCYNAGSVDNNNKFVAQYMMYGNSTIMPIPDLLNMDYLMLIGTNPAHTNMSLAKCSNAMEHIKGIAKRGKVVIIDPRRNETARQLLYDPTCNAEHSFITPSTDTAFLLGLINIISGAGLVDAKFIADHTTGFEEIEGRVASITPDFVAGKTGIPREKLEEIALEFARTPRAGIYARLGTCLTSHPTLNAWAIETLHAITGHLDREGCSIFGHAPFKVAQVGRLIGLGEFDQFRSRIGNHPSVMGALPIGILAKEMMTPGAGQVRALIESGGNLLRCAPNTGELEEVMKELELIIHVDFYLNETAVIPADFGVPNNYFLPATTPLERENIHVTHMNYNIIPHVEYHGPVVSPVKNGPNPEWKIFLSLTRKMGLVPFGNVAFGMIDRLLRLARRELSPGFLVNLLSIIGNFMERHPPWLSSHAITFKKIRERKLLAWKGHRYGILPEFILTKDRKVHLAHPLLIKELDGYLSSIHADQTCDSSKRPSLQLIGRRHLKTMNSWMHNIPSLWKEGRPPFLLLNPRDARDRGINDGDDVRVRSNVGVIDVPARLTEDMMPGVVCYPHGWGHGVRTLSHAKKNPGANFNRLTSSSNIEWISGMPRLNGVEVMVDPVKKEVGQ
ncbi:MAG: molybdopterin-containing oxidoreductase family protein [Promethearchaeota archaeon]